MKKEDLLVAFQFIADALKEEPKQESGIVNRITGEIGLPLEKQNRKYSIDLDDKEKTTHIKELMDKLDEKYMISEEDNIKNMIANQRKQFEDTIKKLKYDLKNVLNPTPEPKTQLDVLKDILNQSKEVIDSENVNLEKTYSNLYEFKSNVERDEEEIENPQVKFRDEFKYGLNGRTGGIMFEK